MKLREALNLYKLHAKPQKLSKYDNAEKFMTTELKWAYLWVVHPGDGGNIDFGAGRSSLEEFVDYCNLQEGTEFNVTAFSPEQFAATVKEIGEYYLVDDNDEESTKYYNGEERKFLHSVKRMQPKAMMTMGIEYDMGVAVFDADVEFVRTGLEMLVTSR